MSARWVDVKDHRVEPNVSSWNLRFLDRAARSPQRRSVVQVQFTDAVSDQEGNVQGPRSPAPLTARPLDPIDPFDDPFGDYELPQGSQLPPPPSHVPTALQPVPSEDSPLAPPDGQPAPLPPPNSELAPLPPDDSMPCDRIYNGRNCCNDEESCRKAREAVLAASIRNISVDITPQLTVARLAIADRTGGRTYEQEMELSLAEAPSRIWRNRQNEVVADGHLADFRDNQVVVRESDGNLVRIPFADLSEDDNCFLTAWWSIPSECIVASDRYAERHWLATTMTWKASALCHKPLYFEDVQLERYGHTAGPLRQPLLSTAHFFLNVAALPYQMGINPPNECQYALGYYRPGNCAPWLLPPVPLSARGALLEAGVLAGGISVLP